MECVWFDLYELGEAYMECIATNSVLINLQDKSQVLALPCHNTTLQSSCIFNNATMRPPFGDQLCWWRPVADRAPSTHCLISQKQTSTWTYSACIMHVHAEAHTLTNSLGRRKSISICILCICIYIMLTVGLPEPRLRLCGSARLFSPSAGPYCTTAFLRLKSMQRPLE